MVCGISESQFSHSQLTIPRPPVSPLQSDGSLQACLKEGISFVNDRVTSPPFFRLDSPDSPLTTFPNQTLQ